MSPARLLTASLLVLAIAPAGASAVPHTWVAGFGDDVSACSRTAPCKSFAGALSKTDAGGTITALDGGNFGAPIITKSLTLDGAGRLTRVTTNGTSGVTVNGANVDVVLRGLLIDNIPGCTAAGGASGVRVLAARSVRIEGSAIRGFSGAGVAAETTVDGATISVRDSTLINNCTAGVVARRAGGSVTASVFDSFVGANPVGVLAGAGATVRIGRNTVTANVKGLDAEAGATLASFGDNRVGGNASDGAPTALVNPPAAGQPAPSTGTANAGPGSGAVPTPTPTLTPTATPTCTVPKVLGLTFRRTVDALFAAGCRLGKLTYRYRRSQRRLRIYRQDVRPGVIVSTRTRVGVTISAKPPRRGETTATPRVPGGESVTWVSGVGDDTNDCVRLSPCMTWANALSKTLDGGTINAMDPGNYGPVTINAPVNLEGTAGEAVIIAPTGASGITIDAGAGADVTVRNLLVQAATPCAAPGGIAGIRIVSARRVHLEDVVVRGFSGAGVRIDPSSAATVAVRGGAIIDNCSAGVAASGPATTILDGVDLARDATAVLVGDGALMRLTGNLIRDNATGLTIEGTGAVSAWPTNAIGGNTAAGAAPTALALL